MSMTPEERQAEMRKLFASEFGERGAGIVIPLSDADKEELYAQASRLHRAPMSESPSSLVAQAVGRLVDEYKRGTLPFREPVEIKKRIIEKFAEMKTTPVLPISDDRAGQERSMALEFGGKGAEIMLSLDHMDRALLLMKAEVMKGETGVVIQPITKAVGVLIREGKESASAEEIAEQMKKAVLGRGRDI